MRPLDKSGARGLVKAMDEELAMWVGFQLRPGPCEPPDGGDPGPTGRIWTYADLFGVRRQVHRLFGGNA